MKRAKRDRKRILLMIACGCLPMFLGKPIAHALNIGGEQTVTEDVVVDLVNDLEDIHIRESSTWIGKAQVAESASVKITVEETSKWMGSAKVDQGIAMIDVSDSTWEGTLSVNGDLENEMNNENVYGNVNITKGTWLGNAKIEEAGGSFSLGEGSRFVGGIEVVNSATGTTLTLDGLSSWQGDYQVHSQSIQTTTNVYLTDTSIWNGNAFIFQGTQGSHFSAVLSEKAVWNGNVESSSNGGNLFYSLNNVHLSNSIWNGNIKTDGDAEIHLENESSWNGDVTLNLIKEDASYISLIKIEQSDWNGDVKSVGQESSSSFMQIEVSDQGKWVGDAQLSGYSGILVAVQEEFSHWEGDLDLRDYRGHAKMDFDNGEIWISDGARWRGRILGSGETVNVKLKGSGLWEITGDSKVRNLSMDYSVLAFQYPGTSNLFSTLTVDGDFTASNSLLKMNTDLAANQGDLLDIRGIPNIDGSIQIRVQNQGGAWVNPENELTIVRTLASKESDFVLANEVEVGGYKYALKQVDSKDFNLYTTERLTSTAEGSINLVGGSYLLNYAETQTFLQRMGELRTSDQKQGVWGRIYGGEFTSSSTSILQGFDMNYTAFQVGRDKKFDLGSNKGVIYFGGVFGHGKGNLEYADGHGSVASISLGLYGSYLRPNGVYIDTLLKYTRMKNDYKVLDTAGAGVYGEDVSLDGISFSLEAGRRIHLRGKEEDGIYLEPQAQLTFGRVTGGSFTASNGLHIHIDDYNSLIGRVGLIAGYEMKNQKNPFNIYGKLSYVHEFDGDVGYRFNGNSVGNSFGDSWWVYGAGITGTLHQKHHLYLDVERASGGGFNQPWAVNGGYRYTW